MHVEVRELKLPGKRLFFQRLGESIILECVLCVCVLACCGRASSLQCARRTRSVWLSDEHCRWLYYQMEVDILAYPNLGPSQAA